MNQQLSNGVHYRLRDGREFHLCGRVESQRVGRVLADGRLVTVSLGENDLADCAVIPYRQRTFSYDSRSKMGMIWRTMQRIGDSGQPVPSPSRRRAPQ